MAYEWKSKGEPVVLTLTEVKGPFVQDFKGRSRGQSHIRLSHKYRALGCLDYHLSFSTLEHCTDHTIYPTPHVAFRHHCFSDHCDRSLSYRSQAPALYGYSGRHRESLDSCLQTQEYGDREANRENHTISDSVFREIQSLVGEISRDLHCSTD
jgi:hypothetical protein